MIPQFPDEESFYPVTTTLFYKVFSYQKIELCSHFPVNTPSRAKVGLGVVQQEATLHGSVEDLLGRLHRAQPGPHGAKIGHLVGSVACVLGPDRT